MAATGVGLLTTTIAAPVAIDLQAGAIACGLLGAGGRFICRRLEAKARKNNQIRVLAVSKLNSIADRISAALTDDKISEEEFRLILSEVDKYNQMKAEIHRGRKKEGGVSETQKEKPAYEPHERRGDANGPYEALGRTPSCWKQWHLSINISCSRAQIKECRVRRLVQPFEQQTSLLWKNNNNNNKKKKKKKKNSLSPGFELTHKKSAKAPRGSGYIFHFLNFISGCGGGGGEAFSRPGPLIIPMLGHS